MKDRERVNEWYIPHHSRVWYWKTRARGGGGGKESLMLETRFIEQARISVQSGLVGEVRVEKSKEPTGHNFGKIVCVLKSLRN